jgi:hypothetical protein
MAGRTNKYGLTDYIPADIRRVVRRACGFGCVICGLAIAQYEHFDPPFEEAREHRADGIAFLCGACHDKKTRGIWSPSKIAAARVNPTTFAKGGAKDAFDLTAPFTLWIGDSRFENVATVVKTREGDRWLSVASSEVDGGPVQISAEFFDAQGASSLIIHDNEWMPVSSQWDTEVRGRTITVRHAASEIVLELSAAPPSALLLSRLRMRRGDLAIDVTPPGTVTLRRAGGETVLRGCSFEHSDTAFLL